MKLGEKIRQLRIGANLTQDDLALKLDIKKPTLSHYETGRTEPNAEVLVKIANFFGITVDELLNDTTFRTPKIVLYGDDGKIVDITTLSKEEQDIIFNLVDQFKIKRR